MLMWYVILALLILATGGALLYVSSCLARFGFMRKLAKGSLKRLRALCVSGVLAVFVLLTLWLNLMNAVVCLLHLVVFFFFCNVVFGFIERRRNILFQRYYAGGMAILLTVFYLAAGWYLNHHIFITRYVVETDKAVNRLRLVMFADSHIGATFNAAGFAKHLTQIEELKPDVVLIAGDYVDDGTTKREMVNATEALGKVKSTYGTYFALGNHDKGYYGVEERGFSEAELVQELEKHYINVLKDEAVLIDDKFYIIGRLDASENIRGGHRAEMNTLVQPLDADKFMVVLDHQPNDYAAEERAEVDLVLSGHTHGGQLFPLNEVGVWIGANDKTYGYEKRGRTNFIVTSGISDWSIKFKTGTKSEIVVIDVLPTEKK